jgi:hypothetical protein
MSKTCWTLSDALGFYYETPKFWKKLFLSSVVGQDIKTLLHIADSLARTTFMPCTNCKLCSFSCFSYNGTVKMLESNKALVISTAHTH